MLEIIESIPSSDTTVNSAMPYENYGDYYSLYAGVYKDHSIYRTLLHFDLPVLSKSGTIKSAELMLYIHRNDYPSMNKEFNIYRLVDKFDENLTYYWNQPSIDEETYCTFVIRNEKNTWLQIDISNLFREWFSGKYQNHGLLIKAVDETAASLIGFYSKDSSEMVYAPKLQISFKKLVKNEPKNTVNEMEDPNLTPEENYHVGNRYFEQNNFERAYRYYNQSYKFFNPNAAYGPKLLFRMATVLNQSGNYTELLDKIRQGLVHYPDFTDLMFLRAGVYHKQGRFTLAIKEYEKCIQLGDSPLHLNFLMGAGSHKAYCSLAEIYLDLEDYDAAYHFCKKAFISNPNDSDPLHILIKISLSIHEDLPDVKIKLESFLGSNLAGKDFMTIAEVFMKENKYDAAYHYITESEKYTPSIPRLSYMKAVCLLHLKEYQKSYEIFGSIHDTYYAEKAIEKMILCKVLNGEANYAAELLSSIRTPEKNHQRMIYYAFMNLLSDIPCKTFHCSKEDMNVFLDTIFDTLNILITAAAPEIFEKSLQLLNLIDSDEVLLRLAKLYYHHGLYDMAYQEFLRSLKNFDRIDYEGLQMMTRAFLKI